MPNQVYDNFYLANEIENQYNSMLNLQRFVTVNNTLVGTPGMVFKVNRYRATDGVEKLEKGEGNTKSIEVGFTPEEYRIQLAQGRFQWYDEEEMTDPMVVPVGMGHIAVNMFNVVNDDIFAEFNKATLTVEGTAPNFDLFVDASAKFKSEAIQGERLFSFVSPDDMAAIRKNLKDSLQYVEAYARTGYVGSVAGIDVFTKADAVSGTIIVASRKAVTLFNKKGSEVERNVKNTRSETAANIRQNTVFGRKYYVAALTDETKVVKATFGG